MQKYLRVILPFLSLIMMSIAGLSQEESNVNRSSVIEQFKGKSYYIHFVQPGETLAEIAKAYEVSPDVIIAENPEAQQKVYINQVLKIPVTTTSESIITKPLTGTQVPKSITENPEKGNETGKPKPSQTFDEPGTPDKSIVIPENTVVTPEKAKSEPQVKSENEKPEVPEDGQTVQKQNVPYFEYTVKKQETLYGIAKKFDVSMDDIIASNPGLKVIENGMTLRIPKKTDGNNKPINEQKSKPAESLPSSKPSVKPVNENLPDKLEDYQVQPKETLYSIAKAHNISIESLIALNPELANGLKAGLVIKVPSVKGKAEPSPVKEADNKPIQRQETQNEEVGNNLPCSAKDWPGKPFKVALMLPFDLAESDSLLATDVAVMKHAGAYKPFNFIQVYEGALIALDSLEKAGANVKFYVYDCDAGNDTTKTRRILQKPEMKDMDLILGPVFAKSSATAARYAEKHQINIVNPLSKRSEIVKGNPFIFKVQPSELSVAEKLAAFIVQKHPGANVLVVRNARADNPDLAKLLPQKIKNQLQQAGRSASSITVNDIIYQAELFGGFSKHLSSTKENIVIVLSHNSVFIPDFISRLNNLYKTYNIILIGSPEWESLDPETDYLVNLNYHQYSYSWIDYSDPAIKNFRKKFQNRFATEPENDKYAYLGYDMTFFFVKALLDFGHDFGPCLENQANKSDLPLWFRKSGIKDGYENMRLNILKIEDYKWVDAEK